MKIIKTTKCKILTHNKMLDATLVIYNQALSYLIKVVEKEFDNLVNLSSKEQMNFIEKLTHKTTKNPNVKYDFDEKFYKFPSYLRRACIMEAIGILKSHNSRMELWKKEKVKKLTKGKQFHKKPPTLNYEPISFPVLYKDIIFDKIEDGKARIKVYLDNDWKWLDIKYDISPLKKIDKDKYKELNPILVKKSNGYYLHIPYQTNVKLNSTPIKQQKVIGVDLGLTKSAVCSCIDFNGTVIDRKFINQSIEKDHLNHTLGRLSKAKRNSGLIKAPNYWRKINNLQKYIIQNTVDEIIKFANKHNAAVIVFEYLGRFKKPKNSYGAKYLRAKLQYWAKSKIIQKTIEIAHLLGIRVSRVLAKGTSKYAYDGSGEVKREGNKYFAKFTTGKIYSADLSASYNIGARYFIREILKPLSEMVRLQVVAKVPSLVGRNTHTLASLIKLREVV